MFWYIAKTGLQSQQTMPQAQRIKLPLNGTPGNRPALPVIKADHGHARVTRPANTGDPEPFAPIEQRHRRPARERSPALDNPRPTSRRHKAHRHPPRRHHHQPPKSRFRHPHHAQQFQMNIFGNDPGPGPNQHPKDQPQQLSPALPYRPFPIHLVAVSVIYNRHNVYNDV